MAEAAVGTTERATPDVQSPQTALSDFTLASDHPALEEETGACAEPLADEARAMGGEEEDALMFEDDGGATTSEDEPEDTEPVAQPASPQRRQPRHCPALWESPFATRAPKIMFTYGGDGETAAPLPEHMLVGLKWKMQGTTPNLVKKMVRKVGFQETNKAGAWLGTWGKHMKPSCFRLLGAHQKINHYPGSFQLGRKDRLSKNIGYMQARHGRKHFDFVPETYCLPNDLPLLKRAWDTAKPKTKWILKPNASARGIGIKVINQWSQIPKRKSVLVQQYLHNPLLVNGTKFDLRIYAYVTSFDPLRIYICKEGLARFATQKYTNKSSKISNRYMHLTNYSVNKKSAAFVESNDADSGEGHKWGLLALLRHLREKGIDTDAIWEDICDIVIKTLLSVEAHINSGVKWNCKRQDVCHELFGFDIMLDRDCKAWLVEVNISPSLASSSPLDRDIKGRLVRDVFNLAGFTPPAVAKDKSVHLNPAVYLDRSTSGFTSHLTSGERSKHAHFAKHGDELQLRGKLHSILDNLTNADIEMLMDVEEEHARCGELVRIFPTETSGKYLQFLETPRYYNVLLDQWVQRHHKAPQRGVQFLKEIAAEAQARQQLKDSKQPAPLPYKHGAMTFTSPNQFFRQPATPQRRATLTNTIALSKGHPLPSLESERAASAAASSAVQPDGRRPGPHDAARTSPKPCSATRTPVYDDQQNADASLAALVGEEASQTSAAYQATAKRPSRRGISAGAAPSRRQPGRTHQVAYVPSVDNVSLSSPSSLTGAQLQNGQGHRQDTFAPETAMLMSDAAQRLRVIASHPSADGRQEVRGHGPLRPSSSFVPRPPSRGGASWPSSGRTRPSPANLETLVRGAVSHQDLALRSRATEDVASRSTRARGRRNGARAASVSRQEEQLPGLLVGGYSQPRTLPGAAALTTRSVGIRSPKAQNLSRAELAVRLKDIMRSNSASLT